jgi:hypothetical protein
MFTWYPEHAAIASLSEVVFAEAFPEPANMLGCVEQAAREGIVPAPAVVQSIAREGESTPDHNCPKELCETLNKKTASQIVDFTIRNITLPPSAKHEESAKERAEKDNSPADPEPSVPFRFEHPSNAK